MQCPICQSTIDVFLVDERLHIYICRACTHRFSVIPTEQQEAYDVEYFLSTHKNWFAHPDKRFFEYIRCELSKKKKAALTVIDVGCGNGDLLYYLHERQLGWKLTGIDLISNDHPEIRFIKGDIYKEKFDTQFDALACLHTIEHVYEPHQFVRTLHSLLLPDSVAIIATIDSSSLIHKIAIFLNHIGFHAAYDRIFSHHHVHHYSFRSLRTIMENNGFNVVSQFNYNHPLKSVDVPGTHPLLRGIYKAFVLIIFRTMRLFGKGMLQTIVCTRA